MWNGNINVSIEEQVKKELEGNLLYAYCAAIVDGAEQYYLTNITKYDGFIWVDVDGRREQQEVHDDSCLEKVKEAYNLIKDILCLDCEEDILMDETKRIVSNMGNGNAYVRMRRQAKNDKKRVLDGDAEFITNKLNQYSYKTVDELIARYDYEIELNDRLAKEAKVIKTTQTPKSIRESEKKNRMP